MQEVLGAPLSNTWSHILGQLHCGEVVMQCVRDWEGWVEDSVNRREQSFSFLIWTPDRVWEEIRRWDLCWRCILRGSKPNGFSSDLSSLWRICWWWWSFQRWALHKLVTCIWTKWCTWTLTGLSCCLSTGVFLWIMLACSFVATKWPVSWFGKIVMLQNSSLR